MSAKSKPVNWAQVQIQYCAGVLTDRAIAKAHGISHGLVQKRAKTEGWERDLTQRIEKKREAKVAKAIVAKSRSQLSLATENQIVEANAQAQTEIILGHRQDIQALKATVVALAGELAAVSHGDLRQALELVLDQKTDGASQAYKTALEKAFASALALGGRTKSARDLVASLSALIDKERQAFSIDKDSADRKSLGEWLEDLS